MKTGFKSSKRDLYKIGLTCLQFNLKKTSRKISSYYDEMLQPVGLKSTQFSVLIVIGIEEATSIAGLAKLADLDRTTLQRSLSILERDKLLQIEKVSKGNIRYVTLTSLGKRKLESAIPYWKTAQENILKKIGNEKVNALLKNLSALRKSTNLN